MPCYSTGRRVLLTGAFCPVAVPLTTMPLSNAQQQLLVAGAPTASQGDDEKVIKVLR